MAVAAADLADDANKKKLQWKTSWPFFLAQLIPLLAFWTGITTASVVVFFVFLFTRTFFITAGYHRYFSHRTYKLGRISQFVFAFGGAASAQKGPLWWAAVHRRHHRYTDTSRDPHSPKDGFWWSHIGWILSPMYKDVSYDEVPEFAKYPELRFIDRFDWIAPWTLGVVAYLVAGWPGLVVGFFGSTLVLWHGTFMVNSVAHIYGRRRYDTPDTSRNNWFVAFMTFGEGWHNNHHHYPMSAKQGFKWWEYDLSYYILRALAAVGIVKDLKQPPRRALESRLIKSGTVTPLHEGDSLTEVEPEAEFIDKVATG